MFVPETLVVFDLGGSDFDQRYFAFHRNFFLQNGPQCRVQLFTNILQNEDIK